MATSSAASASRDGQFSWREFLVHLGLALGLLALSLFLHVERPVDYLRLVAEDNFGEYASAVAWLLMAFFFGLLSLRASDRTRRILWAVFAFGAFFVGMEEISWGQRILGIPTPEALQEINSQGELTLHNILVPDDSLHMIAAWVILLGTTASVLLELAATPARPALAGLRAWLDRVGFPLVPIVLAPWFLLTVYLFRFAPMVKNDEMGELTFGLGLAFFGLYAWMKFGAGKTWQPSRRVLSAALLFIFIAVATQILMSFGHEGGLGDRIRRSATRDYPALGMYRQADMLFAYMEAHPQYLRADTRVAWARQLLARGEPDAAAKVLQEALADLRRSGRPVDAVYLRDEGGVLLLSGKKQEAMGLLERALALDETALSASAGTKRAELLWSQARTKAAMQDFDGARKLAEEARTAAPSAEQAKQIRNWILALGGADSE